MRRLLRPQTPLLRAADSLVVNVVVTAGLGFAFWVLAARFVPAHDLGRDAALLSGLLTLSAVCQLSLTTVILRFLPVARSAPGRAVATAYLVVGGLSFLGALALATTAPLISDRFAFLAAQPWLAPALGLAAGAWGVFSLQDAVLTALGQSGWVPLSNGAFGALKIALLAPLVALGLPNAVLLAWIGATVLIVVPVNVLIFRRAIPRRPDVSGPSPIERFGRRGVLRLSLGDGAGTLLGHAATTMLPLVVAGLAGAGESAYFFVPFGIVAAFDLMFIGVAGALTVEGAASEARLGRHLSATVRRFGPLLVAGVTIAVAAGPAALTLYGGDYADRSDAVLRILACASLFRAVTALHVAVCRVEGNGGRILAVQAATFTLVLGLTAVLAPAHGLVGVAAAWLLAHAAVAVAGLPRLVALERATTDPRFESAACATSA